MRNTLSLGIAVCALSLLAACASQGPATTTLPDGSLAYRIDCGQGSGGMNFCFEKAGKSCGADGYTIVRPDGTFVSSSRANESERAVRVRQNQADRNSILITCGTPGES